jgi:hypothetical protein
MFLSIQVQVRWPVDWNSISGSSVPVSFCCDQKHVLLGEGTSDRNCDGYLRSKRIAKGAAHCNLIGLFSWARAGRDNVP